jgi:hypothetical protein
MSLSLEERVRRLEDRAEIIELTSRYCWYVTRADKAGIVSLYTKDGVFDRSPNGGAIARGHDELLASYGNSGPKAYLPVIHNHIIELAGDEATGTAVLESRISPKGGLTAYYEDRYRRENGKWLFAERKVFYLKVFANAEEAG